MIIPSLDLINGEIVRLYQGNYNKKISYKQNPISILKKYQKFGVQFVHLVDLTGAKNPHNKQIKILQEIVSSSDIPIQIGGGIRNEKDINTLLELGCKRIVIGSLVINNPKKVKEWIKFYGNNVIVLALDVIIENNGNRKLKINGWQKQTNITLENILDDFLSINIKHILCTDISRDGTLQGPNIPLYKDIAKLYPQIQFQASGGVGSINDILKLKESGVRSVIVGRSFIEKKINIKDAIICWQKE